MPEERTVSRFTRIDSTDRASIIVAQTMIYQNLRRQARAAGESARLEVLNADADHEKVTIADASTTLEVRRNGVDITLPFFRDLLSDKPVQGADTIHGLAGWSEGSAVKKGYRPDGRFDERVGGLVAVE
ncbi:hypothetical protein B0H14DRAFT_2585282 [Mycena olivaceomarginata]|nr:hypothetical protein B0H14DRAFT_2585282 [Mycena olivaceomarginata]